MGEKIVGLRDRPAPLPNGAEQPVIDILAEYLECAIRGEIVAVAVVGVQPNNEIRTTARMPDGRRHFLVAGVSYMMHDLCEEPR